MSVVSELGIKDKWGTNLGDYQVQYDVGLLDMVGHGLALIVTIIYATMVQPLGALSAALLNQVANPQTYLGMLEKAYVWLLKPVLSLVSPLTMGVLVASLTLLVMFFRRSTLNSQPNGQLIQNALSSYFVIIFATWLLMNPFKLLRWAFETLQSVINDVTQGLTASSMDGSMTANYLTTVTQLINFGGVLNESGGSVWSNALRTGRDLKDVPQLADHISKVNPGSIFSALSAGGAGIAMMAFSIVCFFLMVFYLFELAWRTAAVPFFMYYGAYNFRRMDLIWETLGRIGSYFGMTAIVALSAVAGPVLATGVIAELYGNKYAFLQIVTSTLVYALMTWLVWTFMKPTGRVAEMMRLRGKNQWRGYMQRSALLMANDKIQGASAKMMKLMDKAERAVIKATTGITVPEGVPTSTTMMAGRMEKMANMAGDTVSNELPRGKESDMKAIEAVPASARQTAFDSAESAKTVPSVGKSSKLSKISDAAKKATAALPAGKSSGSGSGSGSKGSGLSGAAGAVAGALGSGSGSSSSAAGKAASDAAAGAAGGGASGAAASAVSAVAGALTSGKSDKEAPPEVIDGEVVSVDDVPDVGMGNSLNFPEAGDEEGVAQYQMQYMGSTGQFDGADSAHKAAGMDGSAMVGHEPMPQAEPVAEVSPEQVRFQDRLDDAAKPVFYAAGDTDGAAAREMVDPRVPLTEQMRTDIEADPDRGFADQESVKDMSMPAGVEVFGGKAVWTNPDTAEMVALSGEVPAGTPDTVTRQAMMDHAEAIVDPRLREIFIVEHGLDHDEDDIVDAEVVDEMDDVAQTVTVSGDEATQEAAPQGQETTPESMMVSAQAEPVHTVGEGFVDDDATVTPQPTAHSFGPATMGEAGLAAMNASERAAQPAQPAQSAQPVQPDQSSQPVQPAQTSQAVPVSDVQAQSETSEISDTSSSTAQPAAQPAPETVAAPALSARAVSEDTAKRMQREYTESVRAAEQPAPASTPEPVVSSEPAQPAPEPKPAKPADYERDLQVLDRRESAGRAGSSSTAATGAGRGSVEIPRTFIPAADASPVVENLAASSVESVTAVTAREDVFEQSRFISAAMGTGGVTPVPDDDPSLSHTFTVVDGENVVQSGSGLSGGMSW